METTDLILVEVETINETLEHGKIYVSKKYELAIHLCACGWCNQETVTPLGSSGWEYTEQAGKVTLHPSIGNQNMPCKSHYWVRDGKIIWC